MELSKKQVKALLEVISSDKTRHILCNAYVDTYKDKTVLVATDNYTLVALDAPTLQPGRFIHRDELTKWYKLAGAKDILTDEVAHEMSRDDDLNYPKWQEVIAKVQTTPMTNVLLNAKYMMTLETLKGEHLNLKLHGATAPMIDDTTNNLYLIMPIKGGK